MVLCTREILLRPWCVGEMTTARLHNIDTVLIMFPDFQIPWNAFIEGYANVEGVESLAPFGISLELVQTTLWWLGTRPCIVLPRAISLAGVDAVVDKLVSRSQERHEMTTVAFVRSTINSHEEEHEDNEETLVRHWRSGQTVSHFVAEPSRSLMRAEVPVVSIVDHSNQESVRTTLLVRELLKRFFPLTGAGHVLGPDEHLPASVTTVLVMSSNSCLQRPSFVRQLFQAEARSRSSWTTVSSSLRTRCSRSSVCCPSTFCRAHCEIQTTSLRSSRICLRRSASMCDRKTRKELSRSVMRCWYSRFSGQA